MAKHKLQINFIKLIFIRMYLNTPFVYDISPLCIAIKIIY